MTDLSGDGVRVLLMATATHDSPALSSMPAVERSFHDLRTAFLQRCGVRTDSLVSVLDPPDARAMAAAITEAAQQASTVLFVYFIGHGLLLSPGKELYLAARGTEQLVPGMADHQALSFSSLQRAVEASRASSVVVVLDCCYSGSVSLGSGVFGPMFALAPAHGLYLIGSAEQLAQVPSGAVHTAFTGAFLESLETGDPRGPHVLTLDSVYDTVFRKLRDQNRPWPRRQAGDRSGNLVIAPNPAVSVRTHQRVDEDPAPGRCPYPGLDAFGVDDADVFFGREEMTERLLATVATCATSPDDPGPLVLVGPSGSGKTSLLNAGLLAGLREEGLPGLPGSAGWPCVRLNPGTSPLRRLARHLDAEPDAADLMREDPGHAAELVDQLLADRPDRRLVVLVDQLEELFTLCPDPAERTAFLRAVTAIAQPVRDDLPGAFVVLALRADFYGRAAEHPDLLTALRDRQLLVEPMTPAQLRATIEQPAASAGLTLDDGLADVILHEFGATAGGQVAIGALPLLSHVLWATWQERAGSRLTVAGYRAAGGIAQAIATTAEAVFSALDAEGQDATRLMLPRLVRVGANSVDTARPMDRSALLHGVPDPGAAQQAIDRFTEARLLTLDRDTVRISHEALLREWPRLREWLDADRDWLRARQQLSDDAQAWEEAERDTSLLYRGTRLAVMRERVAEAPTGTANLEPGLAEFMDTSWRHERRDFRRRRIAVALLGVLALLAIAGLSGSVAYQRIAARAQDRDVARYLAAQAEALRDSQPGLAKQLSLLSYRIDPDAGRGALFNSQSTPGMINDGEPANDLAVDASGRLLVTATDTAIALRSRDGVASAQLEGWRPGTIAVDPGGTRGAAATYANDNPYRLLATMRLWDVNDVARPRQVGDVAMSTAVTALTVSPDGRTLYAGMVTGDVQRWDLSSRSLRPLPSFHAQSTPVVSLAVTRNGLLATMGLDGQAQGWDVSGGAEPRLLAALNPPDRQDDLDYDARTTEVLTADRALTPVHRLTFDPTGRFLAIAVKTPNDYGGSDDDVHLLDLRDPHAPHLVPADTDPLTSKPGQCPGGVTSFAFSPVSNHFVGKCGISGWQIWRFSTDPGAEKLSVGASKTVPNMGQGPTVFDPTDPNRLLNATDRGIEVWDLSNPIEPGPRGFLPTTDRSGVRGSLAYRSAGRQQLLAVDENTWHTLWDVTNVTHPRLLSRIPIPESGWNPGITLSADGRLQAGYEPDPADPTGESGIMTLRSTADPTGPPLATIDAHPRQQYLTFGSPAAGFAFNPTRPIFAAVDYASVPPSAPGLRSYDVGLRLDDISDPRHPRQITRLDGVFDSVVFSPDGRTLSVVENIQRDANGSAPITSLSRQLRTWDITDPAHPVELWTLPVPPSSKDVNFAVRPDGALLVLYVGGQLRIWHIGPQGPTGEPVTATVGFGMGSPVSFSPDGSRLALTAFTPLGSDTASRPEVWDLSNPDAPVLQASLPASSDSSPNQMPLAYSPDGRILAVQGDHGVDLWDTDPGRIITSLCRTVGDPITPKQWERYLPDRPYQPPCR